jgi:hypothetical protein
MASPGLSGIRDDYIPISQPGKPDGENTPVTFSPAQAVVKCKAHEDAQITRGMAAGGVGGSRISSRLPVAAISACAAANHDHA